MTTLIFLISDQTNPNVLFIRQFGTDKYGFLETTYTHKKRITEDIIKVFDTSYGCPS
jgi:hypothetical protein